MLEVNRIEDNEWSAELKKEYPPWIIYPKGNRLSGHRHSAFSDDLARFEQFYLDLNESKKKEFTEKWVEPALWYGFYNRLNSKNDPRYSPKDDFLQARSAIQAYIKDNFFLAVEAYGKGNFLKARSLFLEVIYSGFSKAVVGDKPGEYLNLLESK